MESDSYGYARTSPGSSLSVFLDSDVEYCKRESWLVKTGLVSSQYACRTVDEPGVYPRSHLNPIFALCNNGRRLI